MLFIAGCARSPGSYPPPAQSPPPPPLEGSALLSFIEMNAADAPAYIVRDIGPAVEGGLWRWARQRPAIRAAVPATDRFRFVMDFVIPDATAKGGPVTIAFAVNGHILDTVRYTTPGRKNFETAAPPALLRAGEIAILTAVPDKTVRSSDGEELSLLMISAGFKP
ncbi:MAG: hypothetical protein EXQ52_02625 [Bryobacterales bacterium]|nr:hypothetical protein [Bryobacterales bacterium]